LNWEEGREGGIEGGSERGMGKVGGERGFKLIQQRFPQPERDMIT
jgi:hypothetical protein